MNPFYTLAKHQLEAWGILTLRLTIGDDGMWEVAQHMEGKRIFEIAQDHPRQMGGVLNSHLEDL